MFILSCRRELMKKQITLLLSGLAMTTMVLAQPIHFKTYAFDYQIPKKVGQACQKVHQNQQIKDTDEYCMVVDVKLLKTDFAWIDELVNGDYGNPQKKQELLNELNETAEWVYKELQQPDVNPNRYQLFYEPSLISHNTQTVQIVNDFFEYSGGPHGMPSKTFYVFDLKKKKQLKIDDIVINTDKKRELEQLVFQAFKQNIKKYDEEHDLVFSEQEFANYQQIWPFYLEDNFYFTPKGMTFSYDPYQIGPYAMGFFILNIDKKALQGIIKPEYLNQDLANFDDQQWSD